MPYVYVTCAVHVTSFSKFRLVSNFIELHALTLSAHSYALLFSGIALVAQAWVRFLLSYFPLFFFAHNIKHVFFNPYLRTMQ